MTGTVLLVSAVACGTPPGGRSEPPAASGRSPREQRIYDAAVARGEIKIGMTRAEVRAAWGRPARVRRTLFQGREVETWIYAFSDVFFDREGLVVAFRAAGG